MNANASTSLNDMHSAPDRPDSSGRSPAPWDAAAASILSNVFFFLARALRYPDAGIYDELAGLADHFGPFFREYGEKLPELPSQGELQAEYVSLFVNNRGSVPAVPYVSCYLDDGLLMGESYFRIKAIMTETGFGIKASAGELEDHLSILLEFVACQISRFIELRESGDPNGARAAGDAIRRISSGFMNPVIDELTLKIQTHATLPFYRVTALVLNRFVHDLDAVFREAGF